MLYFEHRKAGAVMRYRNARDIFPEALLRQIQRYVSGETVYIPRPDGSSKRTWGETSGYQQFIHERNAEHTEEEKAVIIQTAKELSQMKTVFYSGHCTGIPAFELMKGIMGEQLIALHSGEQIR